MKIFILISIYHNIICLRLYTLETENFKDDEEQHKPLQSSDKTVATLTSQNGKNTLSYNLNSYFILVATKPTEKAGIYYHCKMYYEEKATLEYEWKIMFTVVKDLDALEQVII